MPAYTFIRGAHRNIVCVVIDEAHKASTANYAYTQVIQELQLRGVAFRVLALSATPGSDMQKIQHVVQNLKIGHIEVRTEEDPDVKKYIHEKEVQHIMCPSGLIQSQQALRNQMNELISIPLKRLRAQGLLTSCKPDASNINTFVLNETERDLQDDFADDIAAIHWTAGTAAKSGSESAGGGEGKVAGVETQMRARQIQLKLQLQDLEEVRSLTELRKHIADGNDLEAMLRGLVAFKESSANQGCSFKHAASQTARAPSFISSPVFHSLIRTLQCGVRNPKYLEARLPKLTKLKEVLRAHFETQNNNTAVNAGGSTGGGGTKALIFSQLRSTVQEICDELCDVPGIRPHVFVGQSASKSISALGAPSALIDTAGKNSYDSRSAAVGSHNFFQPRGRERRDSSNITPPHERNNRKQQHLAAKGLNQLEQAQVLRDFNAGVYNVLVATSIAEEGLDIAEVDLIVLFETVSSPIRLIQRCGRTGRKRAGKVVMLISSGKGEELCALGGEDGKYGSSRERYSNVWQQTSTGDKEKLEQSATKISHISHALKHAGRTLRLCEGTPGLPNTGLDATAAASFAGENVPKDGMGGTFIGGSRAVEAMRNVGALPELQYQKIEVGDFRMSQVAGPNQSSSESKIRVQGSSSANASGLFVSARNPSAVTAMLGANIEGSTKGLSTDSGENSRAFSVAQETTMSHLPQQLPTKKDTSHPTKQQSLIAGSAARDMNAVCASNLGSLWQVRSAAASSVVIAPSVGDAAHTDAGLGSRSVNCKTRARLSSHEIYDYSGRSKAAAHCEERKGSSMAGTGNGATQKLRNEENVLLQANTSHRQSRLLAFTDLLDGDDEEEEDEGEGEGNSDGTYLGVNNTAAPIERSSIGGSATDRCGRVGEVMHGNSSKIFRSWSWNSSASKEGSLPSSVSRSISQSHVSSNSRQNDGTCSKRLIATAGSPNTTASARHDIFPTKFCRNGDISSHHDPSVRSAVPNHPAIVDPNHAVVAVADAGEMHNTAKLDGGINDPVRINVPAMDASRDGPQANIQSRPLHDTDDNYLFGWRFVRPGTRPSSSTAAVVPSMSTTPFPNKASPHMGCYNGRPAGVIPSQQKKQMYPTVQHQLGPPPTQALPPQYHQNQQNQPQHNQQQPILRASSTLVAASSSGEPRNQSTAPSHRAAAGMATDSMAAPTDGAHFPRHFIDANGAVVKDNQALSAEPGKVKGTEKAFPVSTAVSDRVEDDSCRRNFLRNNFSPNKRRKLQQHCVIPAEKCTAGVIVIDEYDEAAVDFLETVEVLAAKSARGNIDDDLRRRALQDDSISGAQLHSVGGIRRHPSPPTTLCQPFLQGASKPTRISHIHSPRGGIQQQGSGDVSSQLGTSAGSLNRSGSTGSTASSNLSSFSHVSHVTIFSSASRCASRSTHGSEHRNSLSPGSARVKSIRDFVGQLYESNSDTDSDSDRHRDRDSSAIGNDQASGDIARAGTHSGGEFPPQERIPAVADPSDVAQPASMRHMLSQGENSTMHTFQNLHTQRSALRGVGYNGNAARSQVNPSVTSSFSSYQQPPAYPSSIAKQPGVHIPEQSGSHSSKCPPHNSHDSHELSIPPGKSMVDDFGAHSASGAAPVLDALLPAKPTTTTTTTTTTTEGVADGTNSVGSLPRTLPLRYQPNLRDTYQQSRGSGADAADGHDDVQADHAASGLLGVGIGVDQVGAMGVKRERFDDDGNDAAVLCHSGSSVTAESGSSLTSRRRVTFPLAAHRGPAAERVQAPVLGMPQAGGRSHTGTAAGAAGARVVDADVVAPLLTGRLGNVRIFARSGSFGSRPDIPASAAAGNGDHRSNGNSAGVRAARMGGRWNEATGSRERGADWRAQETVGEAATVRANGAVIFDHSDNKRARCSIPEYSRRSSISALLPGTISAGEMTGQRSAVSVTAVGKKRVGSFLPSDSDSNSESSESEQQVSCSIVRNNAWADAAPVEAAGRFTADGGAKRCILEPDESLDTSRVPTNVDAILRQSDTPLSQPYWRDSIAVDAQRKGTLIHNRSPRLKLSTKSKLQILLNKNKKNQKTHSMKGASCTKQSTIDQRCVDNDGVRGSAGIESATLQYKFNEARTKETDLKATEIKAAEVVRIKVEDEEEEEDDGREEEDRKCDICFDPTSTDDDPIVFCEGRFCGGACMHLSCYGIPSVSALPEGDFFCEACDSISLTSPPSSSSSSFNSSYPTAATTPKRQRSSLLPHQSLRQQRMSPNLPQCVLCCQSEGLMKRSTCGRWVHSTCVMFTPELTFDSRTMRANNLGQINTQRSELVCKICRVRGGLLPLVGMHNSNTSSSSERRAGSLLGAGNNGTPVTTRTPSRLTPKGEQALLRNGACVQCQVPECFAAAHPYCAAKCEKWQLITREVASAEHTDSAFFITGSAKKNMMAADSADVAVGAYELYCRFHRHDYGCEGIIGYKLPIKRLELRRKRQLRLLSQQLQYEHQDTHQDTQMYRQEESLTPVAAADGSPSTPSQGSIPNTLFGSTSSSSGTHHLLSAGGSGSTGSSYHPSSQEATEQSMRATEQCSTDYLHSAGNHSGSGAGSIAAVAAVITPAPPRSRKPSSGSRLTINNDTGVIAGITVTSTTLGTAAHRKEGSSSGSKIGYKSVERNTVRGGVSSVSAGHTSHSESLVDTDEKAQQLNLQRKIRIGLPIPCALSDKSTAGLLVLNPVRKRLRKLNETSVNGSSLNNAGHSQGIASRQGGSVKLRDRITERKYPSSSSSSATAKMVRTNGRAEEAGRGAPKLKLTKTKPTKKTRVDPRVAQFFDLEADVSGSDSGDDAERAVLAEERRRRRERRFQLREERKLLRQREQQQRQQEQEGSEERRSLYDRQWGTGVLEEGDWDDEEDGEDGEGGLQSSESDGSEDSDESNISGDFINDGAYTQHSAISGSGGGADNNTSVRERKRGENMYAMYLDVNRRVQDQESPDAEQILNGEISIGKLVGNRRRGRGLSKEESSPRNPADGAVDTDFASAAAGRLAGARDGWRNGGAGGGRVGRRAPWQARTTAEVDDSRPLLVGGADFDDYRFQDLAGGN